MKKYYKIILILLVPIVVFISVKLIKNISHKRTIKMAAYQTNIDLLKPRYKWFTPDINENYNLALNKYQNHKLDTEPIFLAAWMREDSLNNYSLCIEVFDEDMDLLGIIIKEELLDPNGNKNTIEEKYPIYIYDPFVMAVSGCSIPVSIRINDQRKDEKSWDDYLSKDLSYLREQANKYDYSDHSVDLGIDYVDILDQWIKALPIIWISNPKLNNVSIWLQAYDKNGNKSNFVKLTKINKLE